MARSLRHVVSGSHILLSEPLAGTRPNSKRWSAGTASAACQPTRRVDTTYQTHGTALQTLAIGAANV
jgi:hypothetical protein